MRRLYVLFVLLLVAGWSFQLQAQCQPTGFFSISAGNNLWAFETDCQALEVWQDGELLEDWYNYDGAAFIDPQVSPSGSYVAFTMWTEDADIDDYLYIYDVEERRSRFIYSGEWSGWSWTADERIVIALRTDADAFDIAGMDVRGDVEVVYPGNFSMPVLSPSGVVVAYNNVDSSSDQATGDLVVFPTDGDMVTLARVPVNPSGIQWNADFSQFSVDTTTVRGSTSRIFSVEDSTLTTALYGQIVWHPSDPDLFAAISNGRLIIVDGEEIHLSPLTGSIDSFGWSDADHLLVSIWSGLPRDQEKGLWLGDRVDNWTQFRRVG